jgi:hypothetical protein
MFGWNIIQCDEYLKKMTVFCSICSPNFFASIDLNISEMEIRGKKTFIFWQTLHRVNPWKPADVLKTHVSVLRLESKLRRKTA